MAWFWGKRKGPWRERKGQPDVSVYVTLFLGHANMICLIGRERRISEYCCVGEESDQVHWHLVLIVFDYIRLDTVKLQEIS